MQSPPENMSVVAQAERTWANGRPPTRRAQAARYAAHQPASHDSARAPAGKNGWTTAVASASPRSGATTGAASAFAGTGDGDDADELPREGVALERSRQARRQHEDGRHSHEGELETRIEQRV